MMKLTLASLSLRRKSISSWLVFVRVLQALSTLLCAGLNGGILVYIHIKDLDVPKTVYALELMVSSLVPYVFCPLES